MVNVTKRMHKLMPRLWQVKGGAGAATIPPNPSAPQLKSVHLRIPNPCNGFDQGAHSFWRKCLPSFRYHNLTIPITVEQKPQATADFAPTLTLQFEATTQEALERQKIKPRHTDQESLVQWRKKLETKKGQANSTTASTPTKTSRVETLRKAQQEVGIPQQYTTSVGAISLKPQPAADPSAPSTISPPSILYQRTLTLGLRGRQTPDIWQWMQAAIGAKPYMLSNAEMLRIKEQRKHDRQANIDRQRVKAGIDAMRREQADLKRAKEAAERAAAT